MAFDDKPVVHRISHQTKVSNSIKEAIHPPSKNKKPSRSILKGEEGADDETEDVLESGADI